MVVLTQNRAGSSATMDIRRSGPLMVCMLVAMTILGQASAYNILVIAPLGVRSHFLWTSTLTQGLLDHGNSVTELVVMDTKKHPNRTTFVMETAMFSDEEALEYISADEVASPFGEVYFIADSMFEKIESMVGSQGYKRFIKHLKESNKKYDLFLIDVFGMETFFGITPIVGRPPIVIMTPYNNPAMISILMDNPRFPAIAPFDVLSQTPPLGFSDRIYNALLYAFHEVTYKWITLRKSNELMKKLYGPGAPTVAELQEDIALALVNSNPATHIARPVSPCILEVGQLHVTDPKPLPKDLQAWIDSASDDGVIVVSFGSIVNPKVLGTQRLQALATAFGRLRQKVLWKFDGDLGVNIPANVKIQKWLPQNDVVAHPSVVMVMTHGGTLSRQEVAQRGKPIVMVPFLMDQYSNSYIVEQMGLGRRLLPFNITADNVYAVMTEVLTNPKYALRAAEVAKILQLEPIPPLLRAVKAIEQVAALGGAPHLRSAARDLNVFQLYLLDVAGCVLVAVLVLVWAVRTLLRPAERKTKQKRQ